MALRLRGATSGYIELKAPASAGSNTLTLPVNNGSANQILKTDGSGNLSWVDDANTQLTFANDSNNRVITGTGSGLNAEANLTFDGSVLNVVGNVDINNGTGQAHYEISQTNGNTVKFGLVSGSNIELSGSSNNDFYIKLNGNNERLRIDSSGRLLIGHTATVDTSTYNSNLQVIGTDAHSSSAIFGRFSNDASASSLHLTKSRATNKGSHTNGELHDNDGIGNIFWWGSDGTDYEEVARIGAETEALFTGSSTPGALTFHTTASNATTASERLRIASNGDIHSVNKVQSGGNTTAGFIIGAPDTAAYIGVQSKSVANGGSTGNAAFQAWLGSSNTFRVNADGLIKTSKGVDFSGAQTNTAGMTSEVLDAYEEGTWTPANSNMDSVTSYSADYVKIGKVVQISFAIAFSAAPADTAQTAWIDGLPFTSRANATYITLDWTGTSSSLSRNANTEHVIFGSSSRITFYYPTGGHAQTRSHIAGKQVRATFTYLAA